MVMQKAGSQHTFLEDTSKTILDITFRVSALTVSLCHTANKSASLLLQSLMYLTEF